MQYVRERGDRGRPTRSPTLTSASNSDPFVQVQQLLTTIHSEANAQEITASLKAHFVTVENLLESSEADISPFLANCSKSYRLIQTVCQLIKAMDRHALRRKLKISSFSEILDLLRRRIARSGVEIAWCLYFNSSNYLIHEQEIARGTVNGVQIFPREIVKKSILLNATAVIIAHNHPSGETEPSENDVSLTDHLATALSTIGIFLHDHIIISEKNYFSFRQSMLLPMRQDELPLSRHLCSWETTIRARLK